VFFSLPDWALALVLVGVVSGSCVVGLALRSLLSTESETLREPLGVVQGVVFGVVGLVLAFALTLAVGRYEDRRVAVVDDANTIGTTYLRAQTLAEPERSASLTQLRRYVGLSLELSREVPNSSAMRRTAAEQSVAQRSLWRLAGQAVASAPSATVPRLYLETLNEMIDQQTVRLSALSNRVPATVLAFEVLGSAVALALLTLQLSVLGRGRATIALAAALVTGLLLVTFDLDRPTRGLITIPTAPLTSLQAAMALPPAAAAP
jgi:hypothetical protein